MERNVVLYHASCVDGFAAASVAWSSLRDTAKYIPVQYGSPLPEEATECEKLYILDFSYPKGVLLDLFQKTKETVVLDHHKTAKEDLLDLMDHYDPKLYVQMDEQKSGAMLAWEYFNPDTKPPLLIEYIQDRDLWTWGLPHSREVSAWLSIVPKDLERFAQLMIEFQEDQEFRFHSCGRGAAILAAQEHHVKGLAYKSHWVDIAGHRVPAVNSPLFISEIGEELCRLFPEASFAAVFFCLDLETDVWSLRSRKDGFDVSEVAKALGGGGHALAAGFRHKRGDPLNP